MTSVLDHYIQAHKEIFDGSPWYGKSLMQVLEETSAEQVYQRVVPGSHSICEVLMHMLAWRRLFVKRLEGDKTTDIQIGTAEDWPVQPQNADKKFWEQLIASLKENQASLMKGLEKMSEKDLNQAFGTGKYSFELQLSGNLQHDIYHLGQVALLKNLITSFK